MLSYTIRRILMAIPTLWVALTMIFILVRVIPGDPTTAVMGDYVTEKSMAVLKQQMGLDRPILEQYGLYLFNFVRGDFGNSLITGLPVIKELKNALPHTLELTFFGLLLGTVTGIPLGILLALKRNTFWDYARPVLIPGRPFLPVVLHRCSFDPVFQHEDGSPAGHGGR